MIKQLGRETGVLPALVQTELHPYLQERHLQAYCRQHRLHLMCYAPLGKRSGVGPGASKDGAGRPLPKLPATIDHPTIKHIACAHMCSPAQVVLGWSVQNGRTVVPKSNDPGRVVTNMCTGALRISESESKEIDALDMDMRIWVRSDGYYPCSNECAP